MSHYLYNDNLSIKLKIVSYTSINTNIKINNDPIPFLLNEYTEIKKFYEMQNLTKILYFNIQTIHKILYEYDTIIQIQDSMCNSLSFNFYLILLIEDESEIINYEYLINYIFKFNKLKYIEGNKYFNIIYSKIIIELINNYKNCELYDENKDGDILFILENENKEYIKNNINIFREINLDIKENYIYDTNIEELYVDILISLIKNNKLFDFDYIYNIFKQLDLENIDIPFMVSENLFKRMLEVLDINNEYIKKYIINNFDDMNDIKKINFHYVILKYIFKSSFYIYHIPLLFQAHKKIIEILKSKSYFSFNFSDQMVIERIEYIIRKLCDSDYYFICKYLSKKKRNNENEDIKKNLLKNSILTFNISIERNKNPKISEIECIYGEKKNKKISFIEMMKLYDKNDKNENKSELNMNYFLFLNLLNTYTILIENHISLFEFDYNFKLILEFQNTNIKNNNIYDIKVIYIIREHPFFKTDFKSLDENVLIKKKEELEGFFSLMSKLNFQYKKDEKYSFNKVQKRSNINSYSLFIDNNKKDLSGIYETLFDENEYKIIQFEKMLYMHEEPVKFFLCLRDEYYISSGNDKNMILYDKNFKQVLKIKNLNDILYHISEKISGNNKFIELIACYGKNIYLIIINKINYNYEVKKYGIPNIKILFCVQILNFYIIAGLNGVMKIDDLFNDIVAIKNKHKITTKSYKTGLLVTQNHIAFISNKIIPDSSDTLAILDLKTNKIENLINDFSFNLNDNSLCTLKLKGRYILLCACKKYKINQQNGILVVNLNEKKLKYNFYVTDNLEIYCFCQIFENSNFFFAGCFELNKRIGLIKLYQIKDENGTEIQFLQNIENLENNKNFKGFNYPVNNIIQTKYSGKIIVTTIEGGIYLFSKPNLDFYLKKPKR